MRIAVVTLFPMLIRGALAHGVVGRALERGVLEVECFDPRDFATDPHRTVDDRPYGGGPGMVLKPEPMMAANRAVRARMPAGSPVICMSAQGSVFDQRMAEELAALPAFALVAGRYEGLDERV